MRVITSLILLTACVAFAGVSFGVNPIGPMPESYIGYKIGPVVPYHYLNIFNTSGHVYYHEEGYREYRDPPNYEYADTLTWSGSIMAPSLGTKVVLGNSELKPFVRLSAGMAFLLSLNAEINDEDDQEEIDEFIQDIKDGIKNPFVLTGGAGVEYFFTDRFSVGGEFIYRYATAGFYWEEYYDWGDGDWERDEVDVSLNLGGTSAGLWFNYYF
ncbi:MAG: hypothetical protein E3J71_05555 [Candidatus Stahlbacteria bacterium]|nr:MAG: hypothetical protein E3J71_05555 [Candidatus Stahlbacteria bacterium]